MLPPDLPPHISAVFVIITFGVLYWLGQSIKESTNTRTYTRLYGGMVLWLILQAVLAIKGFYYDTTSLPPRPVLMVIPVFLFIAYLFISDTGKKLIDQLSLNDLTYLHTSRIAVEIVLFWLYKYHQVPQSMTFEGQNFDILTGITAPIVGYLYFNRQSISSKVLLIWNILGLLLLVNVVTHGILSVPSPVQQFAFDQPNVAVLKFPFNWLPSFVVPVMLFSHLVAFRQILTKKL